MQMNFYTDAFITFSKIGFFTLGGGYAMLPLIEKEVVDKKHWLAKDEYMDIIAMAQSLPGIMAVNTSIFIGYKMKKVLGSIVCLLATVLPSFIIILLIAVYFRTYTNNPVVISIFKAIRPAIVALIAVPVFTTAQTAHLNKKNIIIPVVATILISFLGISPIFIVLGAGLLGFILGKMNIKL